MFDGLLFLDRELFIMCNSLIANPVFDVFFTAITNRNNGIVPLLLLIPLILYREKKHGFTILGLAIITVAITDPLCCRILKPFFHRLRPCHPSYFVDGVHMFLEGGNFLLGHKTSLSFPSAHAMNMFGQAALFSFLYPKLRVYFLLFASLVAFSRVYVGVHYPTDVLVGALCGFGIGAGVYFSYCFLSQKMKQKKQIEESIRI